MNSPVASLLALMAFLLPALGVPREELLQDTFKSALVALFALAAAIVFFWRARRHPTALRWHPLLWVPLALMAHALGSMAWSHAYLAGVEAVRWGLFALLMWLGLNTFTSRSVPQLARAIFGGAVVASLWAAAQFWFDWRFFPQGPNPGSTFVNRNFFAEYAVCALPFGALLLAQARDPRKVAMLAASLGLVIVAIFMTGTRSALVALWLSLGVAWPVAAWACRRELAWRTWSRATRLTAAIVLLATVGALGSLPTGNESIARELRGMTPLERATLRTQAIRPGDPSLGLRLSMWRSTAAMIAVHPLAGVGAGAWENVLPLYQDEGRQLETDYYAHNEYLQMLAEYGLVGWLAVLALLAYAARAAWRTLRRDTPTSAQADRPWRAAALCGLMALFIVSTIGFAWRLAGTGALFALMLGVLLASDARSRASNLGGVRARSPAWRPVFSSVALLACIAAWALAAGITTRATQAEYRLVRAARLAMTISGSGEPNHPRWLAAKGEMLRLVREGIALNPHYRKITPVVADELARWGDWPDATWIWESVLTSRPHVVAIMTNAGQGHLAMGQREQARYWLERARAIQPEAPSVRSLEAGLQAP